MSHTIRRAIVITAGVSAFIGATGGMAFAHSSAHHHHHKQQHVSTVPESSSPYASHSGDSHHPYGTGSGLSGGPTRAQALPNGEAPVPLQDPTLGEGTLLPPGYNALAKSTGGNT